MTDEERQRRKEIGKAWYLKNRENVRQRNRDYYKQNRDMFLDSYKANKEAILVQHKDYRAKSKNSPKVVERTKRYRVEHIERYKTDEDYRFKCIMRASCAHAFKRIKQNKHTTTQKTLGCTWEEAKKHFENLFKPGMNWNNHGHWGSYWHVDHIKPVSHFSEENKHLMNHISNLQPLWCHENILKSNHLS